jgi:hypothetical protein
VTHELIREYYRCFNERRLDDAAGLFAPEAVVEMPPFVVNGTGGEAYLRFAGAWLRAFPDALFLIESVDQRGERVCEVNILATGTHTGALNLGELGIAPPCHSEICIRMRELMEFRNRRLTYASLAFDLTRLLQAVSGTGEGV